MRRYLFHFVISFVVFAAIGLSFITQNHSAAKFSETKSALAIGSSEGQQTSHGIELRVREYNNEQILLALENNTNIPT